MSRPGNLPDPGRSMRGIYGDLNALGLHVSRFPSQRHNCRLQPRNDARVKHNMLSLTRSKQVLSGACKYHLYKCTTLSDNLGFGMFRSADLQTLFWTRPEPNLSLKYAVVIWGEVSREYSSCCLFVRPNLPIFQLNVWQQFAEATLASRDEAESGKQRPDL